MNRKGTFLFKGFVIVPIIDKHLVGSMVRITEKYKVFLPDPQNAHRLGGFLLAAFA